MNRIICLRFPSFLPECLLSNACNPNQNFSSVNKSVWESASIIVTTTHRQRKRYIDFNFSTLCCSLQTDQKLTSPNVKNIKNTVIGAKIGLKVSSFIEKDNTSSRKMKNHQVGLQNLSITIWEVYKYRDFYILVPKAISVKQSKQKHFAHLLGKACKLWNAQYSEYKNPFERVSAYVSDNNKTSSAKNDIDFNFSTCGSFRYWPKLYFSLNVNDIIHYK